MYVWLLKIVGVVFLGVLVDILYPNGKTNKFCKGIFSLLTLFVIISPIFNLKIDSINMSDDTIVVAKEYQTIHDRMVLSQINTILQDMRIDGVDVEINSIVTNGEYDIQNIYLDVSQMVLLDGSENINIYKDMTKSISQTIGIEDDIIIIYG